MLVSPTTEAQNNTPSSTTVPQRAMSLWGGGEGGGRKLQPNTKVYATYQRNLSLARKKHWLRERQIGIHGGERQTATEASIYNERAGNSMAFNYGGEKGAQGFSSTAVN